MAIATPWLWLLAAVGKRQLGLANHNSSIERFGGCQPHAQLEHAYASRKHGTQSSLEMKYRLSGIGISTAVERRELGLEAPVTN